MLHMFSPKTGTSIVRWTTHPTQAAPASEICVSFSVEMTRSAIAFSELSWLCSQCRYSQGKSCDHVCRLSWLFTSTLRHKSTALFASSRVDYLNVEIEVRSQSCELTFCFVSSQHWNKNPFSAWTRSPN